MNQVWRDKRIHPRSVWGYVKTEVLWIFEKASENDETKGDFQINKKYLKRRFKENRSRENNFDAWKKAQVRKDGKIIISKTTTLKQDEKKKKLFRINHNETKLKE